MIPYLFVGGPWSGRFVTLPDETQSYSVAEPPPMSSFRSHSPVPDEDIRTTHYLRVKREYQSLMPFENALIPNMMAPEEWFRLCSTIEEARERIAKEIVGWAQDAELWRQGPGRHR